MERYGVDMCLKCLSQCNYYTRNYPKFVPSVWLWESATMPKRDNGLPRKVSGSMVLALVIINFLPLAVPTATNTECPLFYTLLVKIACTCMAFLFSTVSECTRTQYSVCSNSCIFFLLGTFWCAGGFMAIWREGKPEVSCRTLVQATDPSSYELVKAFMGNLPSLSCE